MQAITSVITKVRQYNRWESECLRVITDVIRSTEGEVRIALSGGRTPRKIYQRLGEYLSKLTESRLAQISFFVVDERDVGCSDDYSNSKMISETLGGRCFVPFDAILDRPEVYSERILTHLGENYDLDLVVLGVGVDGHLASIFPNSKLMHDESCGFKRNTLASGEIRYSMTYELICRAKKRVIFVGSNREKHALFARGRLKSDASPHLPIHHLLQRSDAEVIIHEKI